MFFINGALQTNPGFTIESGGALDKQAGRVELKDKAGIIRIYNKRRSRTVIDCETPRR